MTTTPSKNTWLRRQQCPCGDWKCYIAYEGETEETLPASDHAAVKDGRASSEAMIAPYVGMVFKDDEEAFEYYAKFARKNGFSMRKERSRLSQQLGVYRRDFVCCRSGFHERRKKPKGEHPRDRKSIRCGCDAKMYLMKEVVDGVSQWFVVQFSNVHNHELLEDDQVRLLPAYRKMSEADHERILLLCKAGIPINRIVKMLELEKGLQGGQLSVLEKDVRNFIHNRKKVIQEKDALLAEKREMDSRELLEACQAMKDADENFVYKFNMDSDDKVENIAWSYADSVLSYSRFGDVVYFETGYRSITYCMIFAAWFGIDNNGRTILFGCALLQDETPRSFAWALQTFVQFMKGKYPQTILTDLDPGLRDAIRLELPNTKHVTSIWNIQPNLSGWFYHPLGPSYVEFRSQFEALYHMESAEEFEYKWNQMVAQFGLGSDRHIALLFSLRGSWALSYIRGYFLARMATGAFIKSVYTFLKGIFSAQTCLRSFFEQVSHAVSLQSQAYPEIQYNPTKTSVPIEQQAQNILTPFAFNAFQHELVLAMQYATSEMAHGSCIVQHFKNMDEERLVTWFPEGQQVHCSCKEFESSGILCRHALRVLIIKNCFQLPETFFLRRWQHVHYDGQSMENNREGWFEEFHRLASALLTESLVTKERSDYVHRELTKELTRLLNEVRNMPACNGVAMDLTPPQSD